MAQRESRPVLISYEYGRGGAERILPFNSGGHGAAALLCRHVLGWGDIRRNARRGLVGLPPSARDGRGVWSVPNFMDLAEAWRLLNVFSRCEDTEVRFHFFALLAETGNGGQWCETDLGPDIIADRIATAALSTVVFLLETRGYALT